MLQKTLVLSTHRHLQTQLTRRAEHYRTRTTTGLNEIRVVPLVVAQHLKERQQVSQRLAHSCTQFVRHLARQRLGVYACNTKNEPVAAVNSVCFNCSNAGIANA